MRLLLTVMLAWLLACPLAFAAEGPQDQNELKIAAMLKDLSTAWQAGDRDAWNDKFGQKAYFVVLYDLGESDIEKTAWDHELIYENFHSDTVFDLKVVQVRFDKPGLAIVQLGGFYVKSDEDAPVRAYVIPSATLEIQNGEWKVIAFTDTPFVINELLAFGDLRRFSRLSSEDLKQL